jgi:hypothetical protein
MNVVIDKPFQPEVKDRKLLFAGLLDFVRARRGWLTSVPGAREVTLELFAWIDAAR